MFGFIEKTGDRCTSFIIINEGIPVTLEEIGDILGKEPKESLDYIERNFYGGIREKDLIGFVNPNDAHKFSEHLNLR